MTIGKTILSIITLCRVSTMTLVIVSLVIITLSVLALSTATLSTATLGIMTLGITKYQITAFIIKMLKMTQCNVTQHCDNQQNNILHNFDNRIFYSNVKYFTESKKTFYRLA
jgi:hypothetical protein